MINEKNRCLIKQARNGRAADSNMQFFINFKLILILFMSLVLLIIVLNKAAAETGCCFVSSTGLCNMNSESDACISLGGEFYSSPSCSVSKCDRGCCILGLGTEYVTSRQCELDSAAHGFSYPSNFQFVDEASCDEVSKSQETGACLFGQYKPYDCKFTTRAECTSGQFYVNTLCSNPSLNTSCTKTTKTTCYSPDGNKEDVHYQDSCGNPDALKTDCNYNSGTICSKSGIDYICKNLNCEGGKRNGESWCVGFFGEGGIGIKTPSQMGVDVSEGYPGKGRPPVGSRYFVQYCINGEIETEPCADFRSDTCGSSTDETTSLTNARCENNPWQECFNANNAEPDPITGSKVDEDECDSEYCEVINMEIDETCYKSTDILGDSAIYCGKEPTPLRGGYVEKIDEPNPMLNDLHLEMCVPKIKGGFEFYPSQGSFSSSSDEDSVCSQATYETLIKFESISKDWYLKLGEGQFGYGNAGLLNETVTNWGDLNDGDSWLSMLSVSGTNNLLKELDNIYNSNSGEITLNGEVIEFLKQRCKAVSDCAAEWNWIGINVGSIDVWGSGFKTIDPEEGIYEAYCRKTIEGGNYVINCPFELECIPWKALDSEEDCKLCGQDNLPCSEYRCKALGKRCEFNDENNICYASNDYKSPVITLKSQTPANPVPPYSSVSFVINTDEISECKFNLNYAGGSFDEMKYDFGRGFNSTHTTTLYLPGQITDSEDEENADETFYPIIKEGQNTLYVRCLDAAGNGQTMAPFLINFEVMKTPDKIILPPTGFVPVSGSAIKYNTTSKLIKFNISEPEECRWSESDKNFENMENNFSCDTSGDMFTLTDGFKCSGILTNVTLNLDEQTRYFIRCKDQPWLEGKEDNYYQRNVMDTSTEYILRPSEKLEIASLSPSGNIKKSGNNITIDIRATTLGGGFSGKSTCYWRMSNDSSFSNSSYVPFFKTNSNTHVQTANPWIGENYIQVKCQDDSENIEYLNTTFTILVDSSSPFINRLYEYLGNLKIKTDEESLCYFSLNKEDNCFFDVENATMMGGVEKEHTTEWRDDSTYYVKCEDYFGNYDRGCGKIIRTY